MVHTIKYHLLLRLTVGICFIIGLMLAINLWLYFQPSVVELRVAHWLQFGQPTWLTFIMIAVSNSWIAVGLVTGGVCLGSLLTKRYVTAAVIAASLASLLLIDPLKFLFQRPRPIVDSPVIEHIAGTSFPSGHAYTATVLAGALCFAYSIGWGGARLMNILVMAVAYILLVSWSRVYLQVHYPSDVVGGIVCGLLILILLSFIYRWLRRVKQLSR